MPFRAIEVKHFANKGKVQKIKALFPHVRKTARKIASYQWHVFFKEGSFKRKANIKHIKSELSERYKYTSSRKEFLHKRSKKAVWIELRDKDLIKEELRSDSS